MKRMLSTLFVVGLAAVNFATAQERANGIPIGPVSARWETNAELRRHCFAHPVFGELDCYQWLLAMGAHFDRHRVQIEEIKAGPNFPQAVG